jgi:hypothetical protein
MAMLGWQPVVAPGSDRHMFVIHVIGLNFQANET